MKRICVIVLFSFLLNSMVFAADSYTVADVVKVLDGNSFKINTGETVKIIGVDTPELVKKGKPVFFSKESFDFAKDKLSGKKVYLVKDKLDKDNSGRLLRYVYYVENGMLFNLDVVKLGYGRTSYSSNTRFKSLFQSAESGAKKDKLGMWKLIKK